MIRIRFHGRGGHGTKTASRIVGTAAFLSGFQVQDSPVYGAERRGAAVVAFTRVHSEPILERGVIERPDLIVLADETLLEVPEAKVLASQETASAIFINSQDAAQLVDKFGIVAPVVSLDLTTLTLATLGLASALSSGLGAAAARMIDLAHEVLVSAVREELSQLPLAQDLVDSNVQVAEKVFEALEPVEIEHVQQPVKMDMAEVRYQIPLIASPTVLRTGNAEARQTGSWRLERPVIDRDACTRCGLCFVRCPDGAIAVDQDGFPIIDYDHCKGCMICHQICPLHAITSERETRAW